MSSKLMIGVMTVFMLFHRKRFVNSTHVLCVFLSFSTINGFSYSPSTGLPSIYNIQRGLEYAKRPVFVENRISLEESLLRRFFL